MSRLSARTIVILALICFIGAILIQAWWIRSAYEGELSLYNKQKRDFLSDVEHGIRRNNDLKARLKNALNTYHEQGVFNEPEQQKLMSEIEKFVENLRDEKDYDISLRNYGIGRHMHDNNDSLHFQAIAFLHNGGLNADDLHKATGICLHCLVLEKNEEHKGSSYQLLFLFDKEKAGIYKKMALLMLGSLLFLALLAMLFRLVFKKYIQEKRLSEAKNDFITNLSHEIQTPVFAVQMANRLIKEKSGQQKDLLPYVDIIEKETKQLKLHAGKILELASLENEQVELQTEITDINAWLEEIRPTVELMLQSKKGKLNLNAPSAHGLRSPLFALLDPTHFHNVIISLIDNTIKYNAGSPEVTIDTFTKDEDIYITISDNGIGIEASHLPFVFDKFYRVPGNEKTKGFGLGLSYVKQIVHLHGGTIDIQSEKEKGTSITIRLPKTKDNV